MTARTNGPTCPRQQHNSCMRQALPLTWLSCGKAAHRDVDGEGPRDQRDRGADCDDVGLTMHLHTRTQCGACGHHRVRGTACTIRCDLYRPLAAHSRAALQFYSSLQLLHSCPDHRPPVTTLVQLWPSPTPATCVSATTPGMRLCVHMSAVGVCMREARG